MKDFVNIAAERLPTNFANMKKNLPFLERSVEKQCAPARAAILATDAPRHRRKNPFVCEQRPVSQHLTRLGYSAFIECIIAEFYGKSKQIPLPRIKIFSGGKLWVWD